MAADRRWTFSLFLRGEASPPLSASSGEVLRETGVPAYNAINYGPRGHPWKERWYEVTTARVAGVFLNTIQHLEIDDNKNFFEKGNIGW